MHETTSYTECMGSLVESFTSQEAHHEHDRIRHTLAVIFLPPARSDTGIDLDH
jgi:hypothetical protein